MARIRQLYPSRYSSTENTSAEFENIIRYLRSGEIGNRTLSELLRQIFNSEGNLDVGLEIRFDSKYGLEYRIGGDDQEWLQIIEPEELRGEPGEYVGEIGDALMFNRADYEGDGTTTVFNYAFSESKAETIVYRNGLLQSPNTYVLDEINGTITVYPAIGATENLTVFQIRKSELNGFSRTEIVASQNQYIIPFKFNTEDEIFVYRNGILYKEGENDDYILNAGTSTITFLTPLTSGDLVTILRLQGGGLRAVGGLLMADEYCYNGKILYDKLLIDDDDISPEKVKGLKGLMQKSKQVFVQNEEPVETDDTELNSGDLWVKTGLPISVLYFYDGLRWISTAPDGSIPSISKGDELRYLRVNSAGSALEFAAIDLSSCVKKDDIGNPNGVAPLDENGQIADELLKQHYSYVPIQHRTEGTIAKDAVITLGYVANVQAYLDKMTLSLDVGTATVQLYVGDTAVGATTDLTTADVTQTWVAKKFDGRTIPKKITLEVTAASVDAKGLTVNLRQRIVG